MPKTHPNARRIPLKLSAPIGRVCGLALFSLVAGIGSTAAAAPTLYPPVGSAIDQIKNSTKADVLADHTNPKAFFVMPPTAQVSESTNQFFNANISFCGELSSIRTTSEALVKRI